jgi:hypothetical protein
VAGLVGTAVIWLAVASGDGSGGMFRMLDADGDGRVTRAEYDEFIRTARQLGTPLISGESDDQLTVYFQAMDKDGNGWLSAAEFKDFNRAVAPGPSGSGVDTGAQAPLSPPSAAAPR